MSFLNKLFNNKKEADSAKRTEPSHQSNLSIMPVDYKSALYITPVCFNDDPSPTVEDIDTTLHFGPREVEMFRAGTRIFCPDLPDSFSPAKNPSGMMSLAVLESPNGLRYIPLFTSYKTLVSIYGDHVRLGVINYETAKETVIKGEFAGIVIDPSGVNWIIPFDKM